MEELTTRVRDALDAHDVDAALAALGELSPRAAELDPVDAIDLLERACVAGLLDVVRVLYEGCAPFVFDSWALALALRCAHEDVARWMLAQGVDLLGDVRMALSPRHRLPTEGKLTRFCFTRSAPTLLMNPMDPTVSTTVFEGFTGREQLMAGPFWGSFDLGATCACVGAIARDGLLDATVYDDLFRAVTIRAWHALRHDRSRDERAAATCLGLGARLWRWHRELGLGDERMERIMGDLVVPRADAGIVAFVCENAPDVFLGLLVGGGWLASEPDLVRSMVAHLAPCDAAGNAALLRLLAANGFVAELRRVGEWPGVLESPGVDDALAAAAEAGHAEAAAWLLSHRAPCDRPCATALDLML